jgi:hypothetical protein
MPTARGETGGNARDAGQLTTVMVHSAAVNGIREACPLMSVLMASTPTSRRTLGETHQRKGDPPGADWLVEPVTFQL